MSVPSLKRSAFGVAVDAVDGSTGVESDTAGVEQIDEGFTDHGTGRRHRQRFGGVDVDAYPVLEATATQEALGEERRLVRRGRALERRARHHHRDRARLDRPQSTTRSHSSVEGVDVVSRLGEAGDGPGIERGAKRDDQRVGGDRARCRVDRPLRGVDRGGCDVEHLDPVGSESAKITGDLLRLARPAHRPQKRRSELEQGITLDQHHPVGGIQGAAQPSCGDGAADASTEHNDCSRAHPLPPFRT